MNINRQERPFYPISHYFKKRFGGKVGKVSVSVAETCPNRNNNQQSNIKKDPCIFCDEWGSAAYHLERNRKLIDQIEHNKKLVTRRMKCSKFLVYFQSYTNTLDKITKLQENFRTAIQEPEVCGLVIGTRPDCLPQRIFPLLNEVHDQAYAMVEIGAQSFFDDQLQYLKRGHTREQNIEAVIKTHTLSGVDIGLHLIFGTPGESANTIIETAKIINSLPVSNVKLHNLHVLKNTELAKYYSNNTFSPDDLPSYAEKVILFLRHLSPSIAIQRLAALSNRWDELIAPDWTRQKMAPLDYIEKRMNDEKVRQGDLFLAE